MGMDDEVACSFIVTKLGSSDLERPPGMFTEDDISPKPADVLPSAQLLEKCVRSCGCRDRDRLVGRQSIVDIRDLERLIARQSIATSLENRKQDMKEIR